MAFLKKCVSTVLKCVSCGKPAVKQVTASGEQSPKWLCLDCVNPKKE